MAFSYSFIGLHLVERWPPLIPSLLLHLLLNIVCEWFCHVPKIFVAEWDALLFLEKFTSANLIIDVSANHVFSRIGWLFLSIFVEIAETSTILVNAISHPFPRPNSGCTAGWSSDFVVLTSFET